MYKLSTVLGSGWHWCIHTGNFICDLLIKSKLWRINIIINAPAVRVWHSHPLSQGCLPCLLPWNLPHVACNLGY